MKKNLTELVFILDRSGSMGGLEPDTIGGFNAMLTRQKEQEGEANVTTILFDHEVQLLHDRFPLHAVAPLTEKDYYVRGCTALLDAIGYGVEKMVNIQRHLPADERAEKVIFVITTDGLENASKRFSYEKIRRLIEREKNGTAGNFCSSVPTWTPCRRPLASASGQTGRCGSRTMRRAWRSTTMWSAKRSAGCGRQPARHPSAQSGKRKSKPISRSGIRSKGGISHVGSNFGRYGRQPL